MTARELYDFSVGQIAWYEKQNEYVSRHLAFCNRELTRSRKEDRELAEFAMNDKPDDPLTVKIFGSGYVSNDTRKLMNERAKYYRERKHNEKMIAHYQQERDYYERFIG